MWWQWTAPIRKGHRGIQALSLPRAHMRHITKEKREMFSKNKCKK